MEKKDENVVMRLPVRIGYAALQDYLRKRLIGEVIKKTASNGEVDEYAEILGLSLAKSTKEKFDLVLQLHLRTLTSFFKNKHIQVQVDIALHFDPVEQQIRVQDYSLEGENSNWLMNKFLQLMANNVLYGNLKKRMQVNLREVLGEQVSGLNNKLENKMEVFPGIGVSGDLRQLELVELLPEKEGIFASVLFSGNASIAIDKIPI